MNVDNMTNVFWNGDGCDKIWSITNGETTFESR